MPITHLAFDIDGVIYSSEGFIADAYKKAIAESGLNLPVPSTSQIMKQIGKPIRDIFTNLFQGITENEMIEFRKWTRKNVVSMVYEKRGMVFEGIPELIENLSNTYTLAACSNGGGRYVGAILKTYGIEKNFIPVLTLESEEVSDKAGLLKSYISKNGAKSSEWVMIGDRKTDLDAAKFNNCKFIGCDWGHAHDDELAEADIIVNQPSEINAALEKLEQA